MIACRLVALGGGSRGACVEVGAQPCKPLDLGGGAVLPGARVARGSVGAGELFTGGAGGGACIGDCRFFTREIRLGSLHPRVGGRARRVDRGKAVQPFEPLGGRSAALLRDIAVPAAKLAGAGDEAFAGRERALVVGVADDDVREPGGEEWWRGDVVDEAVSRGACAFTRGGGVRPISIGLLIETHLKVVAERGGEGAFVAGGGADMIEQAIAALALGGAAQRGGLAVERGEIGAGGGSGGLRGVAHGKGSAFRCFGLGLG